MALSYSSVLVLALSVLGTTIGAESEPDSQTQGENGIAQERVNFSGNKTVKILTGQNKPPPQPVMQLQNQYQHQPNQNQYPPNFPQNPNNNYNKYPQNQYQPDLSGQGSGPQPNYQQGPPSPQKNIPDSAVPQVYVQIIEAIEKLVSRIDTLDSRLQTLENVVLHLTNKKDQPQQGNCPSNFIKVDGIRGKCFHISTLSKSSTGTTEVFDWKSAHAQCNKMGGRLSEMVHYDDFLRISQFLVKYFGSKSKGTTAGPSSSDFWVGGINPGLIWIWSESGQKVGMDGRFWNENDNSSNAPGCLKLSYSLRLDSFFFKGAPCSHMQNILCEIMDNSVARALARFEEEIEEKKESQDLMEVGNLA